MGRFKIEPLIHYLSGVWLAGMMFRMKPVMLNGKKRLYTEWHFLCVCAHNLSKLKLCSCICTFKQLSSVCLLISFTATIKRQMLMFIQVNHFYLHFHTVITGANHACSPSCPPMGWALIPYYISSWWPYLYPWWVSVYESRCPMWQLAHPAGLIKDMEIGALAYVCICVREANGVYE